MSYVSSTFYLFIPARLHAQPTYLLRANGLSLSNPSLAPQDATGKCDLAKANIPWDKYKNIEIVLVGIKIAFQRPEVRKLQQPPEGQVY